MFLSLFKFQFLFYFITIRYVGHILYFTTVLKVCIYSFLSICFGTKDEYRLNFSIRKENRSYWKMETEKRRKMFGDRYIHMFSYVVIATFSILSLSSRSVSKNFHFQSRTVRRVRRSNFPARLCASLRRVDLLSRLFLPLTVTSPPLPSPESSYEIRLQKAEENRPQALYRVHLSYKFMCYSVCNVVR